MNPWHDLNAGKSGRRGRICGRKRIIGESGINRYPRADFSPGVRPETEIATFPKPTPDGSRPSVAVRRLGVARGTSMKTENLPLNVRLLAVLIVCGFAAAVGVYFLHRYQMTRHAAFFLSQARVVRASIEQTDDPQEQLDQWHKAADNYEKYIRFQSGDDADLTDVMAEDALLAADVADALAGDNSLREARVLYGRALTRMEEVLRRAPERRDLRRKQIDLLFGLRQYGETLDHLRFLCVEPKTRADLRTFFDRYSLDERLASQTGLSPSDGDGLAGLLRRGMDEVDSEKLFKFLGNDFWMLLEDAELLSIFGQCQVHLNRREAAIKPLEKSILLAPATLETYRHLAKVLRLLDKPNVADYWMTDMVDSNRDSFRAYQIRSDYRMSLIGGASDSEALVLAEDALADAVRSLQKAIQQIREIVDEHAAQTPINADLREALDALHQNAPAPGTRVTPQYFSALVRASRAIVPAARSIEKTQPMQLGLRDGLVLAAQCCLAWPNQDAQVTSNRLDLARDFALAAVELFPTDAPGYLVMADIEHRAGQTEEAVDCLRRGREATDGDPQVLWRLASSLIEIGELKEARKTTNELAKAGAADFFLNHLDAHIEFSQGNWLRAAEGFSKVRDDLIPWPMEAKRVDLLLAECYGKLGRLRDQRDAYLRCAATDRTWIPALVGLAEAKVKAGQIDEAIEDYRFLMKLSNAPPAARIELARLLYLKEIRLPPSERNWDEVEQTVAEAEKAVPGAVGPTILRAEILIAKGAADEAAKLLSNAENRLAEEIQTAQAEWKTVMQEAEQLSGQARTEKLAEAERRLAMVEARKASRPMLWRTMIGLVQGRGDWDTVEQRLADATKELGDTPTLRLVRARYLVDRYGKDAAPEIGKLAENVDRFSPSEQQELWQALARLAYQVEDFEKTEQLCRRVLEKEPTNLDVQNLRFQIATRDKNVVAMENILDEVRQSQSTPTAFWHYGEAVRLATLAEKGGSDDILEQAKQSLSKASELRPHWGQPRLLAGIIHERQKNDTAAIEAYLQAIDLGVRDPATVHRAARLLSLKNRFREADRLFRLLGQTQPILSDDARREMLAVKWQLGEYEQAAELARNVAANSDHPKDHIWLGQLLGILGTQATNHQQTDVAAKRFAEAEESLRRAVLLKSDASDTWVALIQFYGQTGQIEKAEKTIVQARRKLSPKEAAVALSQCYEVLGHAKRAAEEHESALTIAPRDAAVARRAAAFYLRNNETAKGFTQLHRILKGEVDASAPQKAWARRVLASTMFVEGGEENRKVALELIEQNLQEDPSSAPDQYVKAVMLASDMSGQRRREAIGSLETFLDTQAAPEPEIQFALAQLYLTENELSKYKILMRALLKETRNPHYLQSYATELMAAGELDEAQGVIEELAQLAPNSAHAVRIQAELAFRQRRYEDVLRILRGWLEAPAREPVERDARLHQVAEVIEFFAKQLRDEGPPAVASLFTKEAQTIYQEFLNLKPDQQILMAAFLARQHQIDKALDLLQAKWETGTPEQVALVCFSAMNGTAPSPEQLRRVDQILTISLEKHHQATPLRIALAVLRDVQGRFDEAEHIYRSILEREKNNPTVLNNLAVLLALQEKNLDEALDLVERAIVQVGSTAGLLDSRAMVHLARGNPRLALEDLQRAIKIDPSAMLYFHQAQAFHRNGQRTAAIDAMKKAKSLGFKEEYLQPVERAAYKKLTVMLD